MDLTAIGRILSSQGKPAEAGECCKKAVELLDAICRDRKSHQGDDLFHAFLAIGSLLWSQGQFEQAQRYFEKQVGIAQANHPKEKYPLGHRDVATSLTTLGLVRCSRGKCEEAIGDCQRALAIYEALHPRRAYPDGHPDLMPSLTVLGCALAGKQDFENARPVLERVAQMEQSRGHSLVIEMPEAEALSSALTRQRRADILVSVWRRTKRPLDEVYSYVWAYRGLIQRVVSARQKMIQDKSSPETRRLYDEYVAARQELARLALAPVDSVPENMAARQERLVILGKRKEDLERTLGERVPGLREQLKNQSRPHTDLIQHLPADSIFVDVVLYTDSWIEPGSPGITGARSIPHYLVFLLSRGQTAACVHLGPAKPIDEAAFAWYQDISAGRPGKAVSTVRDLVWEPIKKSLPKGTKTIFICPDGALSAIPWGAIPGSETDSVLLDAYTFMFVPHGQFLLEQMTARPAKRSQDGVCLAVGNVAYDEKPSTAALSDALVAREAVLTDRQVHWPPLPGTKRELDELEDIGQGKRLVKLTGREASTPQVLSNLPKARWAHFGTHGFLASPEVRTAMRLDEALFDWSRTLLSGQRLPIGACNPLLMSGLVLAGANLAPSKDEFGIASGQVGILTSEAIAGLPLQNLDLAVLSACDTAIGGSVVGEGVFGLQRAFHIAGARNVIGTLWKVDDQATAALMRLFYHKLWVEGKSPIVALRESQLAIYRHPEKVADLAATRGPEFAKVIQGVSSSERRKLQKTAPTKAWAAFILSGAGQ
jgi:CHAT domain-containing protein/tetratricopeptide (TPR) repeat protein